MGRRLVCHVAIAAVVLAQCRTVPLSTDSPTISPAVAAAVADGRARVLLELRAGNAFRPEGELAGPEEIAAQRSAIAAIQQTVITRLQGTDAVVLHQYTSAPFLALEIGASALRAIAAMPEVARVIEDALNMPAAGPHRRPARQ